MATISGTDARILKRIRADSNSRLSAVPLTRVGAPARTMRRIRLSRRCPCHHPGDASVGASRSCGGCDEAGAGNCAVDLPLSDIKVDGEKIEFTVATDQFSVVHKGTVAGDEMTLSFDMLGETRQMVARRQAP